MLGVSSRTLQLFQLKTLDNGKKNQERLKKKHKKNNQLRSPLLFYQSSCYFPSFPRLHLSKVSHFAKALSKSQEAKEKALNIDGRS